MYYTQIFDEKRNLLCTYEHDRLKTALDNARSLGLTCTEYPQMIALADVQHNIVGRIEKVMR